MRRPASAEISGTLLQRVLRAEAQATDALLREADADGKWIGELSSSALSTATAVCALSLAQRHNAQVSAAVPGLIQRGLEWLARHQNADGGWGDTTRSFSNISTTALGWAAFGAVPGADQKFGRVVTGAEAWLRQAAGSLQPAGLARAIIHRYGKDRTFSVPILTMCALAGRLGPGREAWKWVLPLPFELAAFPRRWFATLRLPVVSYALPALIAIGQARHHHRPSRNPLVRALRHLARARTLRVLAEVQPSHGGFLEATPLTSFVTMSLVGSGGADHPVARKGLAFLEGAARPDGSWPIDTDLRTWVSTLAVNALGGDAGNILTADQCQHLRQWILQQQYLSVHPYTNAPPGGWAWTDLPGGVPDADDTPGALLALRTLGAPSPATVEAVAAGIQWLLDLQNRDGGIPTFCRGWGKLPFDRSGADLTAHALRAWLIWQADMPPELQSRMETAVGRAAEYLRRAQASDGAWRPLWFGNQHDPQEENLVYGTARTLLAVCSLCQSQADPAWAAMLRKGADWLVQHQHPNGAWGGPHAQSQSIEETALATETLATIAGLSTIKLEDRERLLCSTGRGADWLAGQVESGAWTEASPIGFYFARLWYYEKLYPIIFTVSALRAARRTLTTGEAPQKLEH